MIIRTTGRNVEELDLPNVENAHTPLVENFTHALIEGHEPVVPVADTAKTNTLFDAIYESRRMGMKVNL